MTINPHEALTRLAEGVDDALAAHGVPSRGPRPEPPSRGEAFVKQAQDRAALQDDMAPGFVARLDELNAADRRYK